MTHPTTTTTTTSPYPNSALPVCLISISSPPRAATDMDHPVGIVNLAGWATWAAASDVSAQIKNRKYKKQAAQEYQVKRCPPTLVPYLPPFLSFLTSLPFLPRALSLHGIRFWVLLLVVPLEKGILTLCVCSLQAVVGVAVTLKYNIIYMFLVCQCERTDLSYYRSLGHQIWQEGSWKLCADLLYLQCRLPRPLPKQINNLIKDISSRLW